MFRRWGRFVYRRRRLVAVVAVILAVASLAFASRVSSVLSSGGWYDPGSESQQVANELASEFGNGSTSIVVLYEAPGRTDAASPAFQGAVAQSLARIRADGRVRAVIGYPETGAARFVSRAGDATWVLVQLKLDESAAQDALPSLRSEIGTPPGMSVKLTGDVAMASDTTRQSERDLSRAETLSLPIALVILVLVFGSLLAAGLPLLVAGLAIPTALGVVWLVAQQVTMSVFVTSIVTMLGLALAIDYSLFMVSRFREELARGADVESAVETTVATSGKAVAFSGSAVALGLSGLLFFRSPQLSSMGLGGAIIVGASVLYALTFLPAVLGMLGPNVSRLGVHLRAPWRRREARAAGASQTPAPRAGRWERLAAGVMRRPVAVLVPVLAVLLVLGAPFLGARLGIPGADMVPASMESRQAWDAIESRFPAGETRPIDLLVTAPGDPLSPANVAALAGYSARLAAIPGVARVDGPFSMPDPATGKPLPAEKLAALLAAPASSRPAPVNALLAADVRGSTVHLQAITPLAGSERALDLVRTIRSVAPGSGLEARVGGMDAASVDFLAGQDASLPYALGFTLAAMALMLLLLFGSVVLPIKAVVMTLLSLTASFGALVWIFQDGNLSNVLGFTANGTTIATVPILMFCVVFGLSMDYEVLLLSRMQETYRQTGDNRAAVADGLARTGRVITGAALIMVTVFAAFALGDLLMIKSLGLGMAIAVLLDATIIRALLVPATMRLLGDWNWWSPAPLARLTARLGFGHGESEGIPGFARPVAFASAEAGDDDAEEAVA